MSGYDFSNSEVDDWIAQQYDAGQQGERDNLLLLLQRRRDEQDGNEQDAARSVNQRRL